MRFSTRRKVDIVAGTVAVGLVGVAGVVAALAGDTERIGDYWLHADVDAGSGQAQVVEVIDYDFGSQRRHGILRNIPDVDPLADITVSSPTAPDDVQVSGIGEVRMRIGDPFVTVSNRHRYTIDYPIDSLVAGEAFAWDAVGTGWDVPVDNAEIHVTATRAFEWAVCDQGRSGASGGCDVTQVEPGHLVAEVSGVDTGEGVTITARFGSPVAAVPTVSPPIGASDDPGTGWLPPGLVAVGAAAAGAVAAGVWTRRRGREQVYAGGAADAAFGPREGETVPVRLLDQGHLADMSTIEFESPRGLSAAAGGIIHAERVAPQHQIAWLIEAAIRGEVVIDEGDDDDDMVLRRGAAAPHPAAAQHLDALFGGADEVELGTYDKRFASAWKEIGKDLDAWRQASGLWDPAGERRRRRAIGWGVVAAIVGVAAVIVGGVTANRGGAEFLPLVAVGALLAGGGLLAALTSWELRVRSPQGSARWLQVESFRRFIADSEARHAEAAAQMGLLRQYTAWAVALGELDHWKDAVEDAAREPGSGIDATSSDFHFVALAPSLSSATTSTFTAPSSSGSGGGGGGVGGGGGGGGGGSW